LLKLFKKITIPQQIYFSQLIANTATFIVYGNKSMNSISFFEDKMSASQDSVIAKTTL
jgi:hypothetical protein